MKPLKFLILLFLSTLTLLFSTVPTFAQIRLPGSPTVSDDYDYKVTLDNLQEQTGIINLQVLTINNNFTDTIETEDYIININGQKGKKYIDYTAQRKKKNYYCDTGNKLIHILPVPIIGVFGGSETEKFKVRVDFNSSTCKNKDPITAYFTPTEVSYGATTWNLTLHTTERATIDQQQLQYWTHKFSIQNIVNQGDNIIVITLRPYNAERLENIECNSYNLTIPKNALTSIDTQVKNTTDIIGEFRITNCPLPPKQGTEGTNEQDGEDGTSTGTYINTGSTLKEGNLYLSILDTDENGKQYINISNLVYLLGIVSFFLILFFVLFGFLKNSFLGKGKKY